MKRKHALLAAALITALTALAILAVGVNAALNPNSVPVNDGPNVALAADPAVAGGAAVSQQAQAQIDQLKALIAQYQGRERQYQQQLNQSNTQVTQFESILTQLQQAGVIRIQNDGTITLGRGFVNRNSFPGGSINGLNGENGNDDGFENRTPNTIPDASPL
jgi:hypothetical protein